MDFWILRLSKGLLTMLTYWSEMNRVNRTTDRNLITNSRDEPGVYILLNFSNRDGSGSGSCKIGISHVPRKTGNSHVPLPLPSAGRCPHRRSQTSILYSIFPFFCLFHFYFLNDCRFNHLYSSYTYFIYTDR